MVSNIGNAIVRCVCFIALPLVGSGGISTSLHAGALTLFDDSLDLVLVTLRAAPFEYVDPPDAVDICDSIESLLRFCVEGRLEGKGGGGSEGSLFGTGGRAGLTWRLPLALFRAKGGGGRSPFCRNEPFG